MPDAAGISIFISNFIKKTIILITLTLVENALNLKQICLPLFRDPKNCIFQMLLNIRG